MEAREKVKENMAKMMFESLKGTIIFKTEVFV